MSGAIERWRVNPVTLKELRVGLRERRIFILQVLFLLILLAFTMLTLPQIFDGNRATVPAERLSEAGSEFFQMLFWTQLVLLLFTMPALTCGSLSGERERHNLDMVLASRLTAGELVNGKLGFALYCLTLLLSSSLPLSSVAFFLGGVSLGQAVASYALLFLFGSVAAALGLFYSARENRSNYSTVQAYLLMLLSSLSLPFYGALRSEDVALPWGGLQLTADWFVLGLLLYLLAFLCLKARHRLRPEARNLALMALLFLLLDAFFACWYLALSWDELTGSSATAGWTPFYLLGQLMALGFFLNAPTLDRARELKLHRRRVWAHPVFWLVVLTAAVWLPEAVAGFGPDSDALKSTCTLATAWLLLFPLATSWLHRLVGARWSFGVSFFLLLALLMFLPALGSFSGGDNPLHFMSPLLAFGDLLHGGLAATAVVESSLLSAGVGLPLLGLALAWKTRSRK